MMALITSLNKQFSRVNPRSIIFICYKIIWVSISLYNWPKRLNHLERSYTLMDLKSYSIWIRLDLIGLFGYLPFSVTIYWTQKFTGNSSNKTITAVWLRKSELERDRRFQENLRKTAMPLLNMLTRTVFQEVWESPLRRSQLFKVTDSEFTRQEQEQLFSSDLRREDDDYDRDKLNLFYFKNNLTHKLILIS